MRHPRLGEAHGRHGKPRVQESVACSALRRIRDLQQLADCSFVVGARRQGLAHTRQRLGPSGAQFALAHAGAFQASLLAGRAAASLDRAKLTGCAEGGAVPLAQKRSTPPPSARRARQRITRRRAGRARCIARLAGAALVQSEAIRAVRKALARMKEGVAARRVASEAAGVARPIASCTGGATCAASTTRCRVGAAWAPVVARPIHEQRADPAGLAREADARVGGGANLAVVVLAADAFFAARRVDCILVRGTRKHASAPDSRRARRAILVPEPAAWGGVDALPIRRPIAQLAGWL